MRIKKQELLELLAELPEEIELEEVMYRLYFRRRLETAMRDFQEGRVASLEQALREEG
ncbi:MAG: hypothetical protein HC897_05520 [Thermoanaerobaculia bacterium]|nr:hypothetical protein [Thermoanaerobaculia bacterium]